MEEQARLRDAVYERFLATGEGLLSAGPSVVTWDKRAGHRREVITVNLGEELDDVARTVFTEGHCHSLAVALSEQGYEVAAIISIHALPGHEFDSVRHFYVVDKDDSRYGIDANGRRAVEEIVSAYADARTVVVKDARGVVASLVASNSYVGLDVEAGRWAAARITW
jgi:3-polyprenyl-4-hydroxybenzoate decarboxylase